MVQVFISTPPKSEQEELLEFAGLESLPRTGEDTFDEDTQNNTHNTQNVTPATQNETANAENGTSESEGGEASYVLEEPADDATLIFQWHTESLFCCSLEPTEGNFAVSGGLDGRAYVWRILNGEVHIECGRFNDSVICALFSPSGWYVAVADMSGVVKVWNIATQALVWTSQMGNLNWLEWHPSTTTLFCGCSSGDTNMWHLHSGEIRVFAGHGHSTECGKVLPDGNRLAIAYKDGTVKVFEIDSQRMLYRLSGGAEHYRRDISSIDADRFNMIATGSLDSVAKLYDTNLERVLSAITCQRKENEEPNDVAIAYSPDSTILALATLSGEMIFWDFPSQSTRKFQHTAGVTKLVWHPTRTDLVFSAGLDGVVKVIDARNGSLIRQYVGHICNIVDMAITRDGRHIVTASRDRTCRVFSVEL